MLNRLVKFAKLKFRFWLFVSYYKTEMTPIYEVYKLLTRSTNFVPKTRPYGFVRTITNIDRSGRELFASERLSESFYGYQ